MWLRQWLSRGDPDRALDRELRFHVDERMDLLVSQGVSRKEAYRRARAELGGIEPVKEHCRDARWFGAFDHLLRDLRFAGRLFHRRPAFAVVCVVTLALGLGANTALFSVVHAVLLRPLPFADADRLVVIWERDLTSGRVRRVTPANYRDWQAQSQTFADIALIGNGGFTLIGDGEPERLSGAQVSANYFAVLGVEPLLGRTFRLGETERGADRVAVLGYGVWQRRFGGDPGIVGRQLMLDGPAGGTRTVIGVMPAGAYPTAVPVVPALPLDPSAGDVWVPLALPSEFRNNRFSHVFGTIARLRSGVTLRQAQADMDRLAAALEETYAENTDEGVAVIPFRRQVVQEVQPALVVLLGAVGFVLLIACGNLASLGLARASVRHREVAMRTALGASRGRLIQQFLTESLVIALVGGVLGVLVGLGGVQLLRTLGPSDLPRLHEVSLNGVVLMFTAALSVVTGLVVGVAPAWHVAQCSPRIGLGDRAVSGGPRVQRLRSTLLIGEIAAAVVLLVGTGLLLKSFINLTVVDPGFDAERVLTVPLSLSTAAYPERTQIVGFYDSLLERLSVLPGVESAAAGYDNPLSTRWIDRFSVVGRPPPRPGEALSTAFRPVTVGYFRTAGIRLRQGRVFAVEDRADAPGAVIVNQAFADAVFPVERALGQRLAIGTPSGFWGDEVPDTFTVVGIVDNVRFRGLDQEAQPAMYVPFAQFPQHGMDVVVRTEADPLALVPALREVVWDLDPNQPLGSITTLETLLTDSVGGTRFTLVLVALFGSVAVGLSLIGLYSVLAYLVAQRRREMGVRLALGARPVDLFRVVIRHGVLLVGVGLGVGLAGAILLTRTIGSLLYATSPTDAGTLLGVAVVFSGVGLTACLVPARRAARVDPVVALQAE